MRQCAWLGHVWMGQGTVSNKRHVALTQYHHVCVVRPTQDTRGEHRLRRTLGNDTVLKADDPWHMAGNGVEVMRSQEDGHALPVELMEEVQNVMLSLQVH